ncbi:MAG: hypothetical protein JW808_05525, partial [Victivallales bacterium]|nr:hypothetical protein [Victivallales bacterium]
MATQRSHPLIAGFDGEDFRDWRGASTLVPSRSELKDPNIDLPYNERYGDGWHWGNRGSVSSCIIEKPHFSGWTPILEQEFDLAFSALLELRYSQGLVILNMLDMEDRSGREPVAETMMLRILEYAAGWSRQSAKTEAVYLGGADGEAILSEIGLAYTKGAHGIPADTGVVVLGENARVGTRELEAFVEKGGNIVVLPPWPQELPFGLKLGPVGATGEDMPY